MNSPFFWRNVCVLLLLLANIVFACWLVFSRKVRERLNKLLRPPSVVLRAACLLYATVACLMFFTALQFFYELELYAGSRECWRAGQRWAEIQTGMTERQVVEILDQPLGRDTWTGDTVERFRYCLHPMDLPDGNLISFKIEPALSADERKVIDKSPTDAERLSSPAAAWLPPRDSYVYDSYKSDITQDASITALFAILALTAIIVIPLPLKRGWYSLTLYAPFILIPLLIAYEIPQQGSYRFDLLFIIFPACLIILAGWLIRLIIIAVRAARGARPG